jgi:hypothetical protein
MIAIAYALLLLRMTFICTQCLSELMHAITSSRQQLFFKKLKRQKNKQKQDKIAIEKIFVDIDGQTKQNKFCAVLLDNQFSMSLFDGTFFFKRAERISDWWSKIKIWKYKNIATATI